MMKKLLKRKEYTSYLITRFLGDTDSVEFYDKCQFCIVDLSNNLYCGGAHIGKVQAKIILE